jgi:hypothetical protein
MLFRVDRNNYFDKPKDNAIFTPKMVIDMIMYILDERFNNFNPEYILEPNFGSGNILNPLLEKYPKSKFYAIEMNKKTFDKFDKKNKNVKFINKDFLISDIYQEFDLCICNPPFNCFYGEKVKKGAWKDFLNKTFNLLSDKGKMIYILPNYWCMNSPKYIIEYVKYMPSMNFIPLPKDVFYKNSIPCQIVIFDKENKDFKLHEIYKKLYRID